MDVNVTNYVCTLMMQINQDLILRRESLTSCTSRIKIYLILNYEVCKWQITDRTQP